MSTALLVLRRPPQTGRAPTAAGALAMATPEPTRPRRRRKVERENDAYAAFARRVIRALGRRAGEDIEALPELVALGREVEAAIQGAIARLRAEQHHSWADVALRLGTTRQAAQQRYGTREGAVPMG